MGKHYSLRVKQIDIGRPEYLVALTIYNSVDYGFIEKYQLFIIKSK